MKIRNMASQKWSVVVALLAVSALPALAAPASPAEPASDAPGFLHSLSSSRFLTKGGTVSAKGDEKYELTVGEHGVFARNRRNGSSRGIPNGGAPATEVGPFGSSDDEHNKAIQEYFVASGLPTDQIAGVDIKHLIGNDGSSGQEKAPSKLIARYTRIRRSIEGIPVADSVAWARMNADGQVVSEGVHWPAIPAQVIVQARQMKTQIAAGKLRSLLPANAQAAMDKGRGQLAIRHGGFDEDAVDAVVSFDVMEGSTRPRQLHFDINGKEFQLARERRPAPQVAPARPPRQSR